MSRTTPTPSTNQTPTSPCQEYAYMVHLFPSLFPFLFLSQPVLADHTPFSLYLSTRTDLQSFVLCAPFPTRPRHRVTKRVTFPFLFIPRPLDDRGPFLFHRCLPSSLTYPQARPLSLVVRGSAWGEGFSPSTTQQATRHITSTTCRCYADFIIVRFPIIVPPFIVVPLSPWQRRIL